MPFSPPQLHVLPHGRCTCPYQLPRTRHLHRHCQPDSHDAHATPTHPRLLHHRWSPWRAAAPSGWCWARATCRPRVRAAVGCCCRLGLGSFLALFRLVLGKRRPSSLADPTPCLSCPAGASDIATANRIAREMIFRCGFRWAACCARYCLRAPAMGRSLRRREQQPAPLPYTAPPAGSHSPLCLPLLHLLLQQAAGPGVADDQ